MMEVSWPLSTVPTKEKVRCRIWLFSSERFFFNSMASNYRQTQRAVTLLLLLTCLITVHLIKQLQST